jgi:hypothetical protein
VGLAISKDCGKRGVLSISPSFPQARFLLGRASAFAFLACSDPTPQNLTLSRPVCDCDRAPQAPTLQLPGGKLNRATHQNQRKLDTFRTSLRRDAAPEASLCAKLFRRRGKLHHAGVPPAHGPPVFALTVIESSNAESGHPCFSEQHPPFCRDSVVARRYGHRTPTIHIPMRSSRHVGTNRM